MKNNKKNYVAPDTELTRVEIESAICGGSAKIEAQSPDGKGVSTTEQDVNSTFSADFSDGTDWDSN